MPIGALKAYFQLHKMPTKFDAVKFAADFEVIAAELAKLIQANASGTS